jgi:hypothetical protein
LLSNTSELKISVGSNWPPFVQPAIISASANTEAARYKNPCERRTITSAFRARCNQFAQHFRAAARTSRRQRIAYHHVSPSPRRRYISGLPCGKR